MKKRSGSKGFTIVEMLMVLGVIAVLLGLVTTAAMTAIRHARGKKTAACLQIIQNGIASYRAQYGKWPKPIDDYADEGRMPSGKREDKLDPSDYDNVLKQLVDKSLDSNNPLMDVSGLIVSASGTGKTGVEYREAIKKRKNGGPLIPRSRMIFGYLSEGGNFSRFTIRYNADTDYVTVTK